MSPLEIRIAATFTAEAASASCSFLLETVGFDASVEFAPFNQIFQELLNPQSFLRQNTAGANVVLVRLEDLAPLPAEVEKLLSNGKELVAALRTACAASRVPFVLVFCPASSAVLSHQECASQLKEVEIDLARELEAIKNLSVVMSSQFTEQPSEYDNPRGFKLASVPYTDQFYAALGQVIARRTYSSVRVPHKVIAVDCDNTLWKGVVGEIGPSGIELSRPFLFLQEFLKRQYESGMLLCLASKNNEADVWEAFSQRSEMILQPEHIVASRINWERKSENVQALSRQLDLGVDSFIFIDDDPVVCAEMEANCPNVLTICLPAEPSQFESFFNNHWAFDRAAASVEDTKRTEMYRENVARNQLLEESSGIEDFLASLELKCDVKPATSEELSRVAQLTQRTNQFNTTTIRRTEQEIQHLLNNCDAQCLVTNVRDRFGDYGLVGAVIYFSRTSHLEIDSFLLSCRALGRGVEHQILTSLGCIAKDQGKDSVVVNFNATEKNLPARNFLESFGAEFKSENEGLTHFSFPIEVVLNAGSHSQKVVKDTKESAAASTKIQTNPSAIKRHAGLRRIAAELHRADSLLACLKTASAGRPNLSVPFVEAADEAEVQLARIWQRVLNIEAVGVLDDFFELGGDSLIAVSLFVEIEAHFSKALPLDVLFNAPTVRSLARVLTERESEKGWRYLVPIQTEGTREPLFCMHAAGGNVLFYRDLARHLGNDQPVYGVQARETEETGAFPNRVEEMARKYVEEILTLQPQGPYYLCGSSFGGLVAFEVAQQLRRVDKEVALLALFDTYGPGYPQLLPNTSALNRKGSRLLERVLSISGQLQQEQGKEKIRFVAGKARKALVRVKRRLVWTRNEFQISYNKATGRELPKDLQRNHKAIQEALQNYQPQVYEGKLTLFRAATQPKGIVPDPFLGWRGIVTGQIELHESPGVHGAMTVDPYAKSLAEGLRNLRVDKEVQVATHAVKTQFAGAGGY
jgi:FkbH-like protein